MALYTESGEPRLIRCYDNGGSPREGTQVKKSDIQTHNSFGFGGPHYPAINVKMHRGPGTSPPSTDDIMERFKCSRQAAEKALEFAVESAQELFWEQIQEDATEIFGGSIEVYSAGRCGGWLIVKGLPEIETWNAIMVGKWSRLAKRCRKLMRHYLDHEQIFEEIDANQWAEDGAEKYNFCEDDNGETQTISELKRRAIAAGFGPVVRK